MITGTFIKVKYFELSDFSNKPIVKYQTQRYILYNSIISGIHLALKPLILSFNLCMQLDDGFVASKKHDAIYVI
jgi:hypothetical protein